MNDSRRYFADDMIVRDRQTATVGEKHQAVAMCFSRRFAKVVAACLNFFMYKRGYSENEILKRSERRAVKAAEKGEHSNGNSNPAFYRPDCRPDAKTTSVSD